MGYSDCCCVRGLSGGKGDFKFTKPLHKISNRKMGMNENGRIPSPSFPLSLTYIIPNNKPPTKPHLSLNLLFKPHLSLNLLFKPPLNLI